MAKLIVLTGSSRKEFELGEFNTIGRHPENSIQVLDRIVSKEHAHIIRQPDGSFMLKDLGSLNGSYIGNVRVTEQILKNNDEITMGNTRMMYAERGPNEDSLQRVTIANSTLNDSHIRHKVDADRSERFMPAKDLPVDTLKRDYEKPVSYTHLDVYKRQTCTWCTCTSLAVVPRRFCCAIAPSWRYC